MHRSASEASTLQANQPANGHEYVAWHSQIRLAQLVAVAFGGCRLTAAKLAKKDHHCLLRAKANRLTWRDSNVQVEPTAIVSVLQEAFSVAPGSLNRGRQTGQDLLQRVVRIQANRDWVGYHDSFD